MKRIKLSLAGALAASLALAGCGGGGGSEPPAPAPPPQGTASDVPAEALASPTAFVAWVGQQPGSETAEPLKIAGAVPPLSETDEPLPID